jgi:membrane dipeptidase
MAAKDPAPSHEEGTMRTTHALLGGLLFFSTCYPGGAAAAAPPASAATAAPTLEARVQRILREAPLIDGHNELARALRERIDNHPDRIRLERDTTRLERPMATDIPRLRAGGLGGQLWSISVPVERRGAEAVLATLEQIDAVNWVVDRYPETFEAARTADDVERIHREGKIACLLAVDGGHSLANSFAVLRQLAAAGVRAMSLTQNADTDWADSATDALAHHGLTPFGERVVREMNRHGIVVDLSHAAPETMKKAIAASQSPVLFSHSAARSLCDHPRNVPDEVLKLVAQNGGLVMVTFAPALVSEEVRHWEAEEEAVEARFRTLYPGDPDGARSEGEEWVKGHPRPRATLAQVADHIQHIRQVAGVDHVGIGSDYDGLESLPEGLESGVDAFPRLLAELLRRGWSDEEVEKVAGRNLLRVLRDNERNAQRILKERSPRTDRIEEVDYQIVEPRVDFN